MSAAGKIMRRIDRLARVTDEPGRITRTFASPAMYQANALVAQWMRSAGLAARMDAVGNLIGRLPGPAPAAKTLLLGSHLDTVRNAGKFDGPLGVLLALAAVGELRRQRIQLPFALEVLGFADEEGVRYQTTYLGSKAVAGCFDRRDLARKDADGISLADAIRNFGGRPAEIRSARANPRALLGYVEAHIEQGPLLEQRGLSVGVVTGIAGQTRSRARFRGQAGHAGTVPMNLRQDALCAAAEFVLAAERLARATPGLVATVGELAVSPGASNVIPGEARLTVDARHPLDAARRQAVRKLKQTAARIASRRNVNLAWDLVQEAPAAACSPAFSALLARAVQQRQKTLLRLPSGAGHDAAVMARITPVAMLFIRCAGGLSHHPDESVRPADVQVALDVLVDFLRLLAGSQ